MKKSAIFSVKRIITSIIAFTLIFSLSSVSVYAATVDADFYKTVYKDVVAVYGDNEKAFQSHYDRYGEKEGRSANVEDAINKRDIRSLLIYFFSKNAGYYRTNALEPGFAFFNADNYLMNNPDLAAIIGNNKAAALEHYLTFGALEGRGCGTTFDPVIAITVMPQGALLTPEQLVAAWIGYEGKASTKDYKLHINFNAPIASIYTATKDVNNYNNNTSAEPNKNDNNDEPSPAPVVNKKFTLLAYVCGSDLESANGNMEATKVILKIVLGAYYKDNTNVLILAGGSDKWKNTYLESLLGGRVNGINKSAIFEINKSSLDAQITKLLADIDGCNSVDDIYSIIDSYDKRKENEELFKQIVEALLNENTMPVLADTLGTNKMGDSDTIASLLKKGAEGVYKADSYSLSLWNHGGGSMEGVCFSDDETGGLTISALRNALDKAGYGSSNSSMENKISLMAFDACLMSGIEIAAYLSNYYDMMYASEETTYGDIDYYHLLKIANQKSGNADLGMELAMAAFMDRSENYLGTNKSLATSAIFKSGLAAGAIEKLNDLAKILSDEALKNPNIYAAIKNARLKCEQFDAAHGSFDEGKEYVDMKNFLQLLIKELEDYQIIDEKDSEIKRAINDAIEASDISTYANAYNYGDRRVLYNINGSNVYVNEQFWNALKGMDLCGVNMFVPYYSKSNSTVERYLDALESIYSDSILLGNYNDLLKDYVEYLKSDKDRVAKLTDSLINGFEESNNPVPGYSDLINMSLKEADGRDYLSIVINSYEPGKFSQYSSGDAYVDLCETIDTMLIYITRKAKAMCQMNGTQTDDYYIDIVVGSKTIYYENLNGFMSSVNVFTDDFDEVNMSIVQGYKDSSAEDKQIIYDFITPSDLEGYQEKTEMIKKLINDESFEDDSKWLSAKGTARADGVDTTPTPVYHLFELNNDGYYEYRGSVILNENYDVVEVFQNAKYITFYHQTVDQATNKLAYAEEYYWTGENDDVINVSKLYGTKEYDLDKTGISISSTGLKQIGSRDDNRYYFAVSLDSTTNKDDVVASDSAEVTDYVETPEKDIFEKINVSMGVSANDSGNAPDKTDSVSKVVEESEGIQDAENAVEGNNDTSLDESVNKLEDANIPDENPEEIPGEITEEITE